MLRLTVDAVAPRADVIARVAEHLRHGAVAAIPTDTLYGLAANPFDRVAVEKIFSVKGRSSDQPLPLIAASQAQVVETLGMLTKQGERLAERYWPGPLTLLLPRMARLALRVTAGTGRVGVRVPGHGTARALCLSCGWPLTATSANVSGQPPSNDPDVVSRTFQTGIDLLVDAGLTPGGPPSTIVDVTRDRPVLIRPGAIPWEEILEWLDRG